MDLWFRHVGLPSRGAPLPSASGLWWMLLSKPKRHLSGQRFETSLKLVFRSRKEKRAWMTGSPALLLFSGPLPPPPPPLGPPTKAGYEEVYYSIRLYDKGESCCPWQLVFYSAASCPPVWVEQRYSRKKTHLWYLHHVRERSGSWEMSADILETYRQNEEKQERLVLPPHADDKNTWAQRMCRQEREAYWRRGQKHSFIHHPERYIQPLTLLPDIVISLIKWSPPPPTSFLTIYKHHFISHLMLLFKLRLIEQFFFSHNGEVNHELNDSFSSFSSKFIYSSGFWAAFVDIHSFLRQTCVEGQGKW